MISTMLRIDFVTIFPRMFDSFLSEGVIARGVKQGLIDIRVHDLRDYTSDKHRSTDDEAYGGGPGMVMLAEPLEKAIGAAQARVPGQRARVILLSPQGAALDHAKVLELASAERLVLVCARYEAVDERLVGRAIDEELSIGDYVLSGGELAAMVVIDAIVRQLPGALGSEDSAAQESFVDGLLDCPHYTRPETYAGERVPEVLLSGHHAEIERWRLKLALGRTWLRRPDLLAKRRLTELEQKLLAEFRAERGEGDRR